MKLLKNRRFYTGVHEFPVGMFAKNTKISVAGKNDFVEKSECLFHEQVRMLVNACLTQVEKISYLNKLMIKLVQFSGY